MRLIDADAFKEDILSGLYIYCQVNKEDIANAIDNAPTVEMYSFETFRNICCETCEEKLRPQGEHVEKYEKILQIVEHWNDKSSSFVSACEAFEKIIDVTKGEAK